MEALIPFLQQGAVEAAPQLLDTTLIHETPAGRTAGRIVEVEAYHEADPASHTFRGQTARNASMFRGAGHLYVYFTYGMHWCANVVAGKAGTGEGILIRVLEPVEGLDIMATRRGTADPKLLCAGPARLTQALAIGKADDGTWLGSGPLRLEGQPYKGPVASGSRIGIAVAQENPWRFWIPDSPYVSRKSQK